MDGLIMEKLSEIDNAADQEERISRLAEELYAAAKGIPLPEAFLCHEDQGTRDFYRKLADHLCHHYVLVAPLDWEHDNNSNLEMSHSNIIAKAPQATFLSTEIGKSLIKQLGDFQQVKVSVQYLLELAMDMEKHGVDIVSFGLLKDRPLIFQTEKTVYLLAPLANEDSPTREEKLQTWLKVDLRLKEAIEQYEQTLHNLRELVGKIA
jgi:hypothetical protein